MKKVIIIDDSATSLNLLKVNFTKSNWEVYDAQNAKIAYEMIYDVAPDLIITDAIMPIIGGFQLIKAIREDEKISKIPVIVYSVLNEKNAKFYIKEELSEYFLRKDDNIEQLIKLSEEIINKFPLNEEYKTNILTTGLNAPKLKYGNEKQQKITEPEKKLEEELKEENIVEDIEEKEPEKELEENIDEENLNKQFKKNYDFTYSDEKIYSNIFSLLYPILNYDLFIISSYSFDKNEQSIFFDIRDIILSPIFQNKLANKYQANDIVLFKKYAPNLKMIINEEEFFSKFEFEFEFKNTKIANVAFYSKDKQKWQKQENIEIIKNALEKFFKARYINKFATTNKDTFKDKYINSRFNFGFSNRFEIPSEEEMFLGIVEVANFSDIEATSTEEDLDFINSKISQSIIKNIDKNEQVYKNDKDEYVVVIYAKDEKQATHKLNYIANTLNQISHNSLKPEIVIGASNCTIDNNFNIQEAQKNARNALEMTSKDRKVVINNA